MKTALLLLIAASFAVPALAAEHGPMKTPSGWFDMENCDFCKNLVADPDLLPNTTWENFPIEKGMMNIMTVAPQHAKSMENCMQAMHDLGMKLESGQVNAADVKMCGHCQAYGGIMSAGVKMENVKGKAAEVMLMTSDDPAVVARIHELVRRDNEEMAQLMPEESAHQH